jgi:hypothetical protein
MPLYVPELVPPGTQARLETSRPAQDLENAGTPFLVYDPDLPEDDLLILHFPFSWGHGAPNVAAMCTSGLLKTNQPEPRRWCFPRFELVVAYYSPGFSEAFLQQFALAALDLREASREAKQPAFGFGDWIDNFPLLEHRKAALLIPPTAEMFQAGLGPRAETGVTIDAWLNPDALLQAGPFGYVQAVPLWDEEFAHVAATGDGFRFFLDHLLASDAERAAGSDASSRILQMDRPSAV